MSDQLTNGESVEAAGASQIHFHKIWNHIVEHLEEIHQENTPTNQGGVDPVRLIDWAEDHHHLTKAQSRFLHQCRRARNAYAHVAFDGYQGPLGFPPKDVADRLGRILSSLTKPPKASSGLPRATTCEADTPIRDALALMREHDFSQLPYRHPDQGWLLVTRAQIAHWVEQSTEHDGACLLDLKSPVGYLAGESGPGAVVPRRLSTGDRLADVVLELEQAFVTPDHEPGGYPTVLVLEDGSDNPPFIMAPDNLPESYRRLGR